MILYFALGLYICGFIITCIPMIKLFIRLLKLLNVSGGDIGFFIIGLIIMFIAFLIIRKS